MTDPIRGTAMCYVTLRSLRMNACQADAGARRLLAISVQCNLYLQADGLTECHLLAIEVGSLICSSGGIFSGSINNKNR